MDSYKTEENKKEVLLGTIKMPRGGLGQISNRLPKPNYHPAPEFKRNASEPQYVKPIEKERENLHSAKP